MSNDESFGEMFERVLDEADAGVTITDSLVGAVTGFLRGEGLAFFRECQEKHGTVSPVLTEGKMPWPVHLREGMQVRNFMRKRPECEGWTDHDFDNTWKQVVELAIKEQG